MTKGKKTITFKEVKSKIDIGDFEFLNIIFNEKSAEFHNPVNSILDFGNIGNNYTHITFKNCIFDIFVSFNNVKMDSIGIHSCIINNDFYFSQCKIKDEIHITKSEFNSNFGISYSEIEDCSIVHNKFNGKFEIVWVYCENHYYDSTVKKLSSEFIKNLREIITHCVEAEAVTHTPSDFPLAKVSYVELEEVLKKYGN